ncbi:MAG: PH domain-containing protein [Candidatus Hodarchaeota archaeon]
MGKISMESFRPDPRLRTLWYFDLLIGIIVYLLIIALPAIGVVHLINLTGPPTFDLTTVYYWIFGILFLWAVPAAVWIPFYYRSIEYQILPEEIVAKRGVIWKNEQRIPYFKVTNVNVRRGPLERIFGLGRVGIQTAGFGATSLAEERIAGLRDPEEVREVVMERIRRFGKEPVAITEAPTPRAAIRSVAEEELLKQILEELKKIREKL